MLIHSLSTGHKQFHLMASMLPSDLVVAMLIINQRKLCFHWTMKDRDHPRTIFRPDKRLFNFFVKLFGPCIPDEGYYCADMDSHYLDTWDAMEKLVDEGLCKSIGLSNFNRFGIIIFYVNNPRYIFNYHHR